MKLKTALRITRVGVALTVLFYFLWLLFKTDALLHLCLGTPFVAIAFAAVFVRCPHCGAHLGREVGKHCPHCGKETGL